MIPGVAKTRAELPWLYYPEGDQVLINSHNFEALYPTLQDAVAGYYARLDLGAAATDQFTADGSQDGTLTNGVARVDDGGLAYSFDGTNDYIDLGTSALFSPVRFACSLWLKAGGTPAGFDGIIGRPTNNGFGDGWGFYWHSSSEIRFWLGGYSSAYAAVTGVTPGQWNHIIGTWDGTTVKLYLNGVVGSKTGTNTGSQTATNQPLTIGRLAENVYNFFGKIDDVLIYSRVPSATEIGYLASQRGAVYL